MIAATLQGNLNKACKQISKALPKRSHLPVLSHFKLETYEGKLYLTATDLDMTLSVGIGAMVADDGAICVPGKLFASLVGKLPKDCRIDLSTTDNKLIIKVGTSETTLAGMDADEFPPTPDMFTHYASIDPNELRVAIDRTAYSAADEDTRPVLQCVCFTPKVNGLQLAAADGFRLAVDTAFAETHSNNVMLVRGDACIKLSSILKGVKESVEIFMRTKKIGDGDDGIEITQTAFGFGDTVLICQCVSGKFPNYQQLIPQYHNTTLTVARETLLAVTKSLKHIAKESNGIVRLELEPVTSDTGKLAVIASCPELGDSRHEIDCHYVDSASEGHARRIAFNVQYLIDMLSCIEHDNVCIGITQPASPGLFWPETNSPMDGDYKHVIMPMFVQWPERPVIHDGWEIAAASIGDYADPDAWAVEETEIDPTDEDATTDNTLAEDESASCPNCDPENLKTGYVESWNGVCPDCGRKIPMCETCFSAPRYGGVCVYDLNSRNFGCAGWQEYVAPDQQMKGNIPLVKEVYPEDFANNLRKHGCALGSNGITYHTSTHGSLELPAILRVQDGRSTKIVGFHGETFATLDAAIWWAAQDQRTAMPAIA